MTTAGSIRRRGITLIATCGLFIAPWVVYQSPDWLRSAMGQPVGEARLLRESGNGNAQGIYECLSSGVDVNAKAIGEYTALHLAVMSGNVRAVQILLGARADIAAASNDGTTPLSLAVSRKQPAIVATLLKGGANPNQALHHDLSALHLACSQGELRSVELLLRSGAMVNARTDSGMTPLISAVSSSDEDAAILKELLLAGADPNLADVEGSTPLMHAALHGREDAVCVLLGYGADPTQFDHDGHNARMLAEQGQYWTLAAMLSGAESRHQA